MSSLRRGHANLLCIVPILVYVLPKQVQQTTVQAKIIYCIKTYVLVDIALDVTSIKTINRDSYRDIVSV